MPVNIAGLHIFGGVPPLSDGWDLFATTGRTFFVGTTACPGGVVGVDAAGAYGDTPYRPFATLDYAHNQCTASRGDTIIVMPGHAETVSTSVAFDLAGVRVVGLGMGRNRPAFTRGADIDMFDVTAANVRLHNLRLAATATTTNSLLNINAADLKATQLVFEHSTGPLIAVTVPAAGDRFWFEDCLWLGTGAGPDICIDLEASGAGNDFTIKNCMANYRGSAGLDLAFIRNTADTTIGGLIDGLTVISADVTVIDFNSSLSTCDGLIRNVAFAMTAAIASIEDAVDNAGYMCVEVRGTDIRTSTGTRALIPATTVT